MTQSKHIVVVIVCLLATACGTKVKAKYVEPARLPVAGIKTIAVGEFRGRCCLAAPHIAEELSRTLTSKLESETFFEVVMGKPEMSANEPLGIGEGWQRWGTKYGAQGILGATVYDAEVIQTWSSRKQTEMVPTGRYRTRVVMQEGRPVKKREEIVEKKVRHIPILRKRAVLNIAVALYDVASGERVAFEEYVEKQSRRAEGHDRIKRMDEDQEFLEDLMYKIADRVLKDLIPQRRTAKIKLAHDGETGEGEKLAKQGNWAAAEASWKAALARNPGSSAALYNVGVAAELHNRFDDALGYYRQALSIEDKDLYRKAVQRAKRRWGEETRLREQMKGRETQ